MPGETRAPVDAASFLQLGSSRDDSDLRDVVLLGVAAEQGTVGRSGAALGPAAVRRSSHCFAPYNVALGTNFQDEITVRDGGDLPGVESVQALLQQVKSRCRELAQRNQIVGLVGGNQLLTLGALRGIVEAKRRPVALLHLSARHALARSEESEASALTFAQKERLLKVGRVLQIGLRGPHATDLESQDAFRAGFERLTVDDVRGDIHAARETVRAYADEAALYVSCDLSVLDPSSCPGVTRPSLGGLTSWELQQVLRALLGADVVGFDVVGIAPGHDAAELTSMTAVSILFELLSVVAATRSESRISQVGGALGRTSA